MTKLFISLVAMLLAACASSVEAPSKPRPSAGAADAAAMGYHGPVHRMPAEYAN
jgi:hypothetical protein